MEVTFKISHCWIHATLATLLVVLGACNSDEIRLESASNSQGSATDSATDSTSMSATMSASATETVPTGGSASFTDSEAGSNSQSGSQSTSDSASATDITVSATDSAAATATDSTAATATDSTAATATDGTASATDGTIGETLSTIGDTDLTLSGGQTETGDTGDTGDTSGETGEVCDPGVPQDTACGQCMAANCCDSYKACVDDMACACLIDNCTAPNAIPVVCAVPCALDPGKLMKALEYLTACSEPCGVQCSALGLL